MMGAFKLFEQSYLNSKLIPLSVRELVHITTAPCDIYKFENHDYELFIRKGGDIYRQDLKSLVEKCIFHFYIEYQELKNFQIAHQESLRNITRAMSVGDPIRNSQKQMSLLTINMGHLFKDPINDTALDLQYQSAFNLVNFLIDNDKRNHLIFKAYSKQKHHYTLSQPLLSSILLCSFLRFTKHFSEREVKMLFMTSYFKDIGMSLLPTDTFEKENLDETERKLVKDHSIHSINILQGRVPLNPSYFNIISNHHNFSLINPEEDDDKDLVEGIETLFVVMMDMFVAMISKRPYREGITVYEALKKLSLIYGKDYPREFKAFVQFIQRFFTRIR